MLKTLKIKLIILILVLMVAALATLAGALAGSLLSVVQGSKPFEPLDKDNFNQVELRVKELETEFLEQRTHADAAEGQSSSKD